MGTGDDDANRMEQILSLGSGPLSYLVDNCLESLWSESVTARTDASCELCDDFSSNFRGEQRLIVFCLHRCLSVVVEQELGLVRELL